MHPAIFGSATFPIFLAVAVAVGTAVHLWLVRRAGLPVARILALYAGAAAAMFAGAWLFGAWIGSNASSRSWLTSRLRYPGALLGLLAALPWLGRWLGRGIPLRLWGDLMVPGAAFALATLRVDCLLTGCCSGRVCNLPWAITFPPGSRPWYAHVALGLIPRDAGASLPVHPLQLYFLLLALSLGLLALWWLPRRAYDGQVVLLFLALHEGSKFLLELLRDPPLLQLQGVSLAVSLAATLTLAALWVRARSHARLEAT
jgi:phosphatidylglycerol:prolipoprotein diacylglycerol transferase